MSATQQRRLATGVKWGARVLGVVGIVFHLGLLWGSVLAGQDWMGQIAFAIGMPLTLGGLITSWWKTRLAGVCLILSYVGPICFSIYLATKNHVDCSPLVAGLPSLIAGGLLLLSWRLSEKARSSV